MKSLQEKEKNKNKSLKIIGIAIATISLLFIVFFIALSKLTEPKAMTISLTETNEQLNQTKFDKSNTELITILLGENNRIIYYMGALGSPVISPKETKYGKNGIHRELTLQNKNLIENSSKLTEPKKLFVIIKPGTKSTNKNLIDILDEMIITNTHNYAIVKDFTPEEEKLLASK